MNYVDAAVFSFSLQPSINSGDDEISLTQLTVTVCSADFLLILLWVCVFVLNLRSVTAAALQWVHHYYYSNYAVRFLCSY